VPPLDDQEACDIAAYFSHQPRPDFPDRVKDWPKGGKPRDARYQDHCCTMLAHIASVNLLSGHRSRRGATAQRTLACNAAVLPFTLQHRRAYESRSTNLASTTPSRSTPRTAWSYAKSCFWPTHNGGTT